MKKKKIFKAQLKEEGIPFFDFNDGTDGVAINMDDLNEEQLIFVKKALKMKTGVYYTCVEGGEVKRFPQSITRREAVKELKQRRVKDEETGVCLSSLLGWTVHSVFFVRDNIVTHIWDSTLNGYRDYSHIKKIVIPNSLR